MIQPIVEAEPPRKGQCLSLFIEKDAGGWARFRLAASQRIHPYRGSTACVRVASTEAPSFDAAKERLWNRVSASNSKIHLLRLLNGNIRADHAQLVAAGWSHSVTIEGESLYEMGEVQVRSPRLAGKPWHADHPVVWRDSFLVGGRLDTRCEAKGESAVLSLVALGAELREGRWTRDAARVEELAARLATFPLGPKEG